MESVREEWGGDHVWGKGRSAKTLSLVRVCVCVQELQQRESEQLHHGAIPLLQGRRRAAPRFSHWCGQRIHQEERRSMNKIATGKATRTGCKDFSCMYLETGDTIHSHKESVPAMRLEIMWLPFDAMPILPRFLARNALSCRSANVSGGGGVVSDQSSPNAFEPKVELSHKKQQHPRG